MTAFDEFTKQQLESWIEHCNKFFDDANVPLNEGVGGVLSVYGRLIKYAVMKNNEIAKLNEIIEELEKDKQFWKKAATKTNYFERLKDWENIGK